jgi:hypothetical protein
MGSSNFGYRGQGSSVLYDDGKVLIVGGHDPPTATAEVIDLNAASPSWRTVAPMSIQRRQLNATLLPDGKVLVTGGSSAGGFDEPSGAVLYAEMWDPGEETWSNMASHARYRGYHATALLLPDGRVLTAGGDTEPNAEVYSPPYLFNGARPTITAAPSSVTYGQPYWMETPDAAGITQVTWIRLSSVTHGFDQNQRIIRLSFSQAPGGLNVTTPSSASVCPPGHYMLFILNDRGVPSVAKILRINIDSPAAPNNLTATAVSGSQIDLGWTDNSVNEQGFKIERSADGISFSQIATVGPNLTAYSNTGLTAITIYYYRVRAFNTLGDSAYSNTANAITRGRPAAPTNLTATAFSGTQINLIWTDNAINESGFKIERSIDGAAFSQITKVGPNVTSYSNTSLTALTTYYYRVRAYSASGNSAYSNTASAKTAALPEAPSNLTATVVSRKQINLAWTDNAADEAGFKIYRSTNGTSFKQIATVGANVTTYSNTGLKVSTTFYYRVGAYNANGDSAFSNTSSATTLP